MESHGASLIGYYNYRLVLASVVIALFAAYAALDIAGRVSAARGLARIAWLSSGAFAMGLGNWSMHYIGMEAFHLPIPVLYDWPTVVFSLVAAVMASAVALTVVSRKTMGLPAAILGMGEFRNFVARGRVPSRFWERPSTELKLVYTRDKMPDV
jgi:NO-binding membrane sensor protein with MHYT domain